MRHLFECVPNISEGRNLELIRDIGHSISTTLGVKLLNTDSSSSAHRTVYTFIGSEAGIMEACMRMAEIVYERIDMTKHQGNHPRIGAIDVLPVIPLDILDMPSAVRLASSIGEMLFERFGVGIYYYERNASNHERSVLSNLRKGEYENLEYRWKHYPQWSLDLIPEKYDPSQGVTVVGARQFLIAYNINLSGSDVFIAKQIARQIRTSGSTNRSNALPALRAIGWYSEELGVVQVSTNHIDYSVTNIHQTYELVKRLANSYGLEVLGSELVGLIPRQALIQAGKFYHTTSEDPWELMEAAVAALGLNSVKNFDIRDHVLEEVWSQE